MSAGLSSILKVLGVNLFLCLFQLLEVLTIMASGLLPIFKASNAATL